jgi:hypothetical protein
MYRPRRQDTWAPLDAGAYGVGSTRCLEDAMVLVVLPSSPVGCCLRHPTRVNRPTRRCMLQVMSQRDHAVGTQQEGSVVAL